MKKSIKWYMILTGGILFLAGLLFLIRGQNLKLPVNEVLNGIIMPFKSIGSENLFFNNDEYIGHFGGIERYFYPSGWKLYTWLYMGLFPLSAYFAGRILTILLSVFGTVLLISELAKECDGTGSEVPGTTALGWLLGLAYGLIAFPPLSSFGFASLPLLFFLLLKVSKRPRFGWFLLILLYPCLSDLYTLGAAVFAGTILFFVCRWIAKKKFPWQVLVSLVLLAAGFFGTEYHFIIDFLFNDNEYVVFIWDRILEALWYYSAVLVFAALLWFFLFMLKKGKEKLTNVFLVILAAMALFLPLRYNDLVHNIIPDKSGEYASYRSFFSRSLFEKAKKDIDYDGEWALAYGLDPSVLTYNGISTLDGNFDFYSNAYQDYCWRILAPSFEEDESGTLKESFEEDGNGFYLMSVSEPSSDTEPLYIDTNAMKDLGGRYIFSAYEISNADDLGLDLAGSYEDEDSPYHLWVYITHSRYKDRVVSDVPFEERSYEDYDIEKIHALEDEMRSMVKDAGDAETVPELSIKRMEELIAGTEEELLRFTSDYRILQVYSDKDALNSELSDLSHSMYEIYLDESDTYRQVLRDVCLSPYSEAVRRRYSVAVVDSLAEYEDMTDEEKERSLKIDSLENEYNDAVLDTYYYEYEGELWDEEMLEERSGELDRETYLNIYYGIALEKASVLGEIYLELLMLHKEEAEEEEYDSYADYAYENVYIRDYDVDETKKMLKEIRKKGSRFVTAASLLADEHTTDYGVITPDDTETYEMLLPYMEDIDPELSESLRHLLDCGLYDLDYAENKSYSTGYTITFPTYGDGFIFDNPYQNTTDLFTYVHEFGHYHHNSHEVSFLLNLVNNVDVDEIHSQGLEMLFAPYYSQIYGEEMGKNLEYVEVSRMMEAIPDVAVVAEFEIYAHEHAGKLTVEDLNKKIYELYKDYGYNFIDGWDQYPFWVDIPHVFQSPHYYISYLTSAMTSLEIYNLSYENRKEAVEKYMEITAYPSVAAYGNVVEESGLSDIFEEGESSKILRDTYRLLKYD